MRFSPERDSSIRGESKRLFKGFVTHALSSCVDYDSRSQVNDNFTEELTFMMDDTSLKELDPDPYVKDLLIDAQLKHKESGGSVMRVRYNLPLPIFFPISPLGAYVVSYLATSSRAIRDDVLTRRDELVSHLSAAPGTLG
ncbi:hypothetical protein QVD17_30298 [Tagetes erecta]|uniref:Uncharacterized protein n=1 Tax=Tagetes erecta TaxID=13708 RepID=A0AAD8K5D1_TARER|nr:hypothetical protein QVD17_30298 [Tagetes erecta]